MKKTSKGTSAPQNTAVGSGSRPTGGRIPIPTSSPAKPQQIRSSGKKK